MFDRRALAKATLPTLDEQSPVRDYTFWMEGTPVNYRKSFVAFLIDGKRHVCDLIPN